MPYFSSTFIASYVSTAKTIRILNSNGQIVFTIAVCNYQKSSVNGNNLNIVLEDNVQEYSLDFSSNTEAKQAMLLFKQAVDTLRLNCIQASGGGTVPSITPIPISYIQYKSLQSTNNLIAFQWYDVTDTTGILLSSGTTIRLQALTTDDAHPQGELLTVSQGRISIDCITDDVLYYEKPDNKVILLNSKVSDQNIDSSSNNIIVKNKSKLTCSNSQIIEIDTGAIVNLTGCNNIKISNSTITISNANNLVIDDLVQNFTGFSFNLSNVSINPYDTFGKAGQTTINSNKTLEAYYDTIDQVFNITNSNNNMTLLLENKIPLANSDFRIKYFTVIGTGNIIAVKNTNNVTIFTITDAQMGSWIKFRWNKNTLQYEFVSIEYSYGLKGTPYLVNPVTDNQILFPLPIPSAIPTNIEMYINGQKRLYGLDFTYSSGSQSITYTNRDFPINSTDEVEFIIY